MDIAVNEIKRTEHGTYYDLSCGSTSMVVAVTKLYVSTTVQNSSHKAWRGMGKHFYGETPFVDASNAYKSAACKAMIEHVRKEEGR